MYDHNILKSFYNNNDNHKSGNYFNRNDNSHQDYIIVIYKG